MRSLLLLLIFSGAFSQAVFACSCGAIPFKEAVDRSSEIFIGTVVKIELERDLLPSQTHESLPFGRRFYWVATLEVSKKWKGSRKSKIRVKQSFNSCEFPFSFYGEYLVFAESGDLSWNGTRNYWTWLCSRTIDTYYLTDWAKSRDLNEGWDFDDREKLDNQFPDPVQTSSFFNNWPVWLFLFIASIGFGALYFRKRNAL